MSIDAMLADAIALHQQGEIKEAEALYRNILFLAPQHPQAHNALGIALQQTGRADEAADSFRRALEIKPDYTAARGNLGAALLFLGRTGEAIECYGAAIAAEPANAEHHYNLGTALVGADRLEEAAASFAEAIALQPAHAGARNNLGVALKALGRLAEAEATFRQAVGLMPQDAQMHYNLSQVLLQRGQFQAGWREHEARFAANIAQARHQDLPAWRGEAADGKTILVWAEQGLGDSIQFCRYLPMLAERGAKVVFEVQAPLVRLMAALPAGITVVARDQPRPPADLQVALMSLPGLLGTDSVEAIPAAIPYLAADPAAIAAWAERLGPKTAARRIGLVWAGSPTHKDDRNRSLPLAVMSRLVAASAVEWISLQLGPAAEAWTEAGGQGLPSPLPAQADFADTAAIMANLDAVVAVDTAALHLAGAMGRPAFGLLPLAADWRWLVDRADSPWYPTLRLLRQDSRGDWNGVLARLAAALAGTA